jgi:nucleotide-binding universal stress UspA family protein
MSASDLTSRAVPAPFPRILCALDGSRESRLALHQALVLADPGGVVRVVAVAESGFDRTYLEEALRAARLLGRRAGVPVTTAVIEARDARRAILEATEGHSLLALGTRGRSRAEAIVLGGTAALALHASPIPVLVARPTPDWRAVGEHVLLATDGTPGTRGVAEIAGAIAARAGGIATLLHVGDRGRTEAHRELALEALDIGDATGAEPTLLFAPGRPVDVIVDAAREHGATLVVVGSRALGGLRALTSVSERVGASAPCSVLALRAAPQAS